MRSALSHNCFHFSPQSEIKQAHEKKQGTEPQNMDDGRYNDNQNHRYHESLDNHNHSQLHPRGYHQPPTALAVRGASSASSMLAVRRARLCGAHGATANSNSPPRRQQQQQSLPFDGGGGRGLILCQHSSRNLPPPQPPPSGQPQHHRLYPQQQEQVVRPHQSVLKRRIFCPLFSRSFAFWTRSL